MSMSVCATDRRRHAWLAALVFSAAASLTGCITQDYVRGLGHHTAKGAMGAVGESIPAIEEPLRQALRRTLVEDDTLRRAAKDMTESAVKTLEAGLASPEMRRQIDDLVVRAMESLARNGDEAVRRLVQGAEPEMKDALRRVLASVESDLRETIAKVAADGIDKMTVRLRERIERDVTPATERLAKRTGEELIASLVAGLEGPLQKRLLEAGQGMSTSLIKGVALGLNEPSNQESFGSLTQVMSLQAVRGARQGMKEGLPDERQVALIASIVVLAALLVLAVGSLSFLWWRYHQSAKSLTIMAENINQLESEELKAAIQQSAHDNYVGPWLSSFLKRRGL
jgi:cobalamin biosynthesis Mg chelatase CobN